MTSHHVPNQSSSQFLDNRSDDKASSALHVLKTVNELRTFSRDMKALGKKIALVPTMGALHEGHLSLVKKGLDEADIVITSVFVNPAQFGPNEDFDAYPRAQTKDMDLIEVTGGHAIYLPSTQNMYPQGFSSTLHVGGLSKGLCGADRPNHFDGVATVVAKLLIQSEADVAIFGEKDYQQLCLIQRLVKDLNLDCQIIGAEIVRDEYGLALSSRNGYLSKDELGVARFINRVLAGAVFDLENGDCVKDVIEKTKQQLLFHGVDSIDYLELRAEGTLEPMDNITQNATQNARLLTAVRVGQARLLDNMRVNQLT